MPIIINELVATIRPEPKAVAREVVREPAAPADASAATRAVSLAREREARLAID